MHKHENIISANLDRLFEIFNVSKHMTPQKLLNFAGRYGWLYNAVYFLNKTTLIFQSRQMRNYLDWKFQI